MRYDGECIQNDLEPHPQILVKLLILGCSSFRVLREDGGDDFLGYVLSPRVYVVDSSSPQLFPCSEAWLLISL